MRLRKLVEGGMLVALALVLDRLILFKMPQGGSVTCGAMVPICVYAILRGPKWGILAGVTFGLLSMVIGGIDGAITIPGILLDYILAFGVLGVAGIFGSGKKCLVGVPLAILGRWCVSTLSGALLYASYAPAGQSPWVYSMVYNASYLLPETAISLAIIAALIFTKILKKEPVA